MKMMRKIKIIIIIKKVFKTKNKKKKKTNTITTNKHLYITDKTLTGEEREKKKYLFITSKL